MKRKADSMDDHSSAQDGATKVDISINGDVLIKVGTGGRARHFKVSGAVISEASPVFATMLASAFREAQTKVIIIEDGDKKSYEVFLRIIHHQPDKVGKMTGKILLEVVQIADMRLCIESVKPFVVDNLLFVLHEFMLAERQPMGINRVDEVLKEYEISYQELLGIAAELGLRDMFWIVTKRWQQHSLNNHCNGRAL